MCDNMRRSPLKHPLLVSTNGGKPNSPETNLLVTKKRETRNERRERECREEYNKDRVAREFKRTEKNQWRKLKEDW